jgi:hypothetical protein
VPFFGSGSTATPDAVAECAASVPPDGNWDYAHWLFSVGEACTFKGVKQAGEPCANDAQCESGACNSTGGRRSSSCGFCFSSSVSIGGTCNEEVGCANGRCHEGTCIQETLCAEGEYELTPMTLCE